MPAHHAQTRVADIVPRQRHLRPLAPVHVSARRTQTAVELVWIRQSRIAADGWGAADMPLGEAYERYAVRLVEDGETRLALDAATPACSLPLAAIDAAFGGRPAAIDIAVAQISDRFGPGLEARLTVAL